MIGRVELTEEQEEQIKREVIKQLKEESSFEFMRKEITDNWNINKIIYTMKSSLSRIVDELNDKPYSQLDSMEITAIAMYQLVKKYNG